jgi:tripartite-type tricarboxylate transporter receptor subunit TctC
VALAGRSASKKVLQASTDGHILVLASPSDLILAPLTMQVVRHKPQDLRLAAVLVNTSLVMLVRPNFDANNFDELVAMAKKPGAKELSYGSPGVGSLYHLAAETFARKAGVKMLHVPYKGCAPMVNDLMGGMIDVVFRSPAMSRL